MIQFYDVAIEAMREATQEDWDALYARVAEKHRRIIELEAQLAAMRGTLEMTHHGGVPFSVTESPPTTPR